MTDTTFTVKNSKRKRIINQEIDMPHKALKDLKSDNFTTQIQSSCGTIPSEDIKRYYDIAMAMDWKDGWYSSDKDKEEKKTPGYKHIPLGGSDTQKLAYEIEQPWVKEIWDKVNPGCVLLKHYLNGHGKNQSEGIHVNGSTNGQYTIIVYLTPDMKPEDGGSIEFWTPNLTDEMRATALGTPWDLNGEAGKDILRAYWPEAGRVIVFDSRIPHVARSVETDKFRVSLVFKGTVGETKKPMVLGEVDPKDFK
jgi:hypothetical protein